MKLLTKLLILGLGTLSLSAQTTMCFKENHKSISTIENAKLNGGLCKGDKSSADMQKEGWENTDIKIDGNNYIYIFKKQTSISSLDLEKIEAKILQRLELKKINDAKVAKLEIKYKMSVSGKKMYLQHCKSCHGDKGELRAKNTSRPIANLSLADFKLSIRDYNIGEYDRGRAFLMKPFATMLDSRDIKNVFVYLQSLKVKDTKEDSKTDEKKEATK